jgi:hypothetical protein
MRLLLDLGDECGSKNGDELGQLSEDCWANAFSVNGLPFGILLEGFESSEKDLSDSCDNERYFE